MKEIEVVTTVKIAGTTTIELKTTIEAQVDYTFEEPLPANGKLEIWIRAGTQDELKFLTIKAATKDDSGNWQKHYPMIGACPAISFKARHKHPDGKSKYSDAIHLKDDTPFFRQSGDHPSDQLYTNDVEELESLVFDNNSNEDIEQIQIYVARNG